jgi:type IV pilus assembly protein PilM
MVYRESVERYRDAVEKAGLAVHNIDLAAFALMRAGLNGNRAFSDLHGDGMGDDVVVLCDIGPTATNVVVSRNGVCELNRLVSFGTHIFSQTMVDQFGWEFDDADRVKTEAGILPLGGIESPGDPYSESRRIMQYVADQFAQEIRTSFDYYHHSTAGAARINRVVLSGEGALLRGIEERFATELGIPVSILDASSRLDTTSVQEIGANHAHLAVALGLGMDEAA